MDENKESKPMVVTVLGNSEGEICRGGWGPRRSSEETTEFTKTYLKRFFGDQVQVEYYDLAQPEAQEQHKALLEKVPSGYLYYPMVFVNNELKIVGSAEYYEVLHIVREMMEPSKTS